MVLIVCFIDILYTKINLSQKYILRLSKDSVLRIYNICMFKRKNSLFVRNLFYKEFYRNIAKIKVNIMVRDVFYWLIKTIMK